MKKISFAITTTLLLSSSVLGDNTSDIQALKAEIQELKEITQILIDETSDLKTGFSYTTVDKEKTYSGLGAAASKVYFSSSPLSIGGYGEMYYQNAKDEDGVRTGKMDVYRFIPYIGYKFSDDIILNTEIEFEHGGAKDGEDGYVIIEFMYLDFLLNQNANIRVGNFLVPMGLISERHEPTLFTTTQRPSTAKYIIPTTWHENGVMVYGDIVDNLTYKVAAITSLQTEANGSKWIRNGRGGSFTQIDPKLGVVARVDYTGINGLLAGASFYHAPSLNGAANSKMLIAEAHIDYHHDALRVYGTYAQVSRSNAKNIAVDAVESANGGYINLSYDLSSFTSSVKSIPLFVQYENINPEQKRVDGSSDDDKITTTLGVNFFPHEQVVLKVDHAMQKYGTDSTDTTSISMGFIF